MGVKAPTGLGISRNKKKLICSWSPGDSKYKRQEFQYNSGGKKWYKFTNLKGNAKNFTIEWDPLNPIKKLSVKVRGRKGGKWSSWSKASYNINPPKDPILTLEYNNSFADPHTTFSWDVQAEDNKREWFNYVEWQTRLVNNNGGSDEPWSSAVRNTKASGSFEQQENSTIIYAKDASYTREFKLTAHGPGGKSKEKTIKYVFARPNVPSISDTSADEHNCDLTPNGRGGYLCEVEWDSNMDSKHPFDSQDIQYAIVEPRLVAEGEETKIAVKTGKIDWVVAGTLYPPLADSKQTYKVLKKTQKRKKKVKKRLKKTKVTAKTKDVEVTIPRDAGTKDALDFTIDQLLEENQVVFVRILIKRGPEALDTASEAYLCDDNFSLYTLSKPTGVKQTLSPDPTVNRITVEATNNCPIDGSFLIVSFCEGGKDKVANAQDLGYITSTDAGIKEFAIPKNVDSYSIGVRAAIGKTNPTPTIVQDSEGKEIYRYYANGFATNVHIESDTVWIDGAAMPKPPKDVALSHLILGTINVTWDWDWTDANSAELSWSTAENAWKSTSEPTYYSITNLYDGEWNIADLELGQTYYVRVRLKKTYNDGELVSRWSETKSIFLSAAPAIPDLELSPTFINPGGSFSATWSYISTDNTMQKSATVSYLDGDEYKTLGTANGEQSILIDTSKLDNAKNWTVGSKKQIAVQVVSESSSSSKWSPSVPLNIVAPATCKIDSTSLISKDVELDVYQDTSQQTTKEVVTFNKVLTHLPLDIFVSGAGSSGTTYITIERYGRFLQPGPDENIFKGYDGEIIYSASYSGSGSFSITRGDTGFIGSLDETASYILRATIEDEYKQTAFDDVQFVVDWEHDATIPEATLEYIEDHDGNIGAKITPVNITGVEEGDVMDIYRLSIDKPQLIVSGGSFSKSYVDPYPTIGSCGGYRVVFRTFNDDFLNSDHVPAFYNLDYESGSLMYDIPYSIISFEGDEVYLDYDVDLSSSWSKDFTETKYLGGSIQGDWNEAVSRTGSITAKVITSDVEMMKSFRRLAVYSGVCHVRTVDGSNYQANVDVSESLSHDEYFDPYGNTVKVASYTLNITRVDSDFPEAVTLEEWNEL